MPQDESRTAALAELRKPFEPHQIGKLPKAGIKLDYVGHAAVTDRLLKVDAEWTWEPLALTEQGLPLFDRDDKDRPYGLWIKLTILRVTRLGYGSVLPSATDGEKQLIGDAIRNAAMRFGVALDLWAKEDLHKQEQDAQLPAEPVTRKTAPQEAAKMTEKQKATMFAIAGKLELTDEQRHELTGGKSWSALTLKEAAQLISKLEAMDKAAPKDVQKEEPRCQVMDENGNPCVLEENHGTWAHVFRTEGYTSDAASASVSQERSNSGDSEGLANAGPSVHSGGKS